MSDIYGPSARKGLEKIRSARQELDTQIATTYPAQEAKGYEVVIQVGADGFAPALQFQGGSLVALLTQATWTFVCMTRVAEDIAALPGVVQLRDPATGAWVTDIARKHELYEILARPFGRGPGLPPWSWQQLIETGSLHHDLTGNTHLLQKTAPAPGGRRRLSGLMLLQPDRVEPVPNASGVATHYSYDGKRYTAAQIVNIMNAAPSSYYDGISPLVAAEKAVAIDYYGHQRQKYDLTQRISPGAIVKIKGHFGLTAEERTEIETMLSTNFAAASKHGKPLVVGETAEVLPGLEQKSGDIPELRKQARDEILAIFRIPPSVAGVMENATLQHSSNALRLYWMQALQPKAGNIYGAINVQAIEPIYGPNVRLWYELSDNELGLAVLKERAITAKAIVDLGFPANDAAAKVGLGMPHHPELDTPNVSMVVAGRDDPAESEPEKESEAENPPKSAVFPILSGAE